jgi:hypothetical protein
VWRVSINPNRSRAARQTTDSWISFLESREVLSHEPFAPTWQRVDWAKPFMDLDPIDADALSRDLETIQNLPEVTR